MGNKNKKVKNYGTLPTDEELEAVAVGKGHIERRSFHLGIDNDKRLQYIYLVNRDGDTAEVINVCLDIKVKGCWETIVRMDSHHGLLHRHLRLSLNTRQTSVTDLPSSPKNKTHKKWLEIAVRDITKNFGVYIKYIKKIHKDLDIEEY